MAKKLSSILYNLARKMNDVETIASLNPQKIVRRAKNKILGRLLIGKLLNKLFRL